jgi:hypothetical protein
VIPDSGLEYSPQWAVAPWNTGIGPVKPISATVTPATPADPYLTVSLDAAPNYSNMLASTKRPLLPVYDPSQIYLSFAFTLTPDDNGDLVQADEFEALYYDENGYAYHTQMQRNNVNPAGMIQAYASPTNVWADTGIVISKRWTEPTSIVVNYLIDTVAHTSSILSLENAGVSYALPAEFQNVPATQPKWTPGIYCQFQLDGAKAGGKFTNKYGGISVNWQ